MIMDVFLVVIHNDRRVVILIRIVNIWNIVLTKKNIVSQLVIDFLKTLRDWK